MRKIELRSLVLRSAAAAALIVGSSLAMAEGPGGERGGGGEPHGGSTPGGGEHGAPANGGAERMKGGERPAPAAEKAAPGPEKAAPTAEKTAPGAEKAAPTADKRDAGHPAESKAAPSASGAPKGGDAHPAGGHPGHANLSGEQRTKFRGVLRGQHVEAIHAPSFAVNVGTVIPERYHFYPLPPALIELVPEYRGYDYILVDDVIIILEPGTRRIIDIIEG